MPSIDCISEADLRAFLLGDLPERVADLVAHHLDECHQCESAARRLDSMTDPIVRTLRRAVTGDSTQVEHGNGAPPDDGTSTRVSSDEKGQDVPRSAINHAGPPGYEILGELGRGGMSVVYEARQRHPRRIVALKMILGATHVGALRKARFLAEADATARLQHPNIVSVYEVGEHDGLPFFSLEYVDGGTLADHLGGVPQKPKIAAELVETLARAVQFAHDQGVVHRDLKPANVLMSLVPCPLSLAKDSTITALQETKDKGQGAVPKIADFGLSKQTDLTLTATGDILGTPQYMAPEQADGTKAVGPPADVYALGAILYECLTGRPPFRGTTALDTLDLVRSREPVAPRALQPSVPRDLEIICLKCLEKNALHRYATADALADDLRRFQSGEPILARPAGVWERGLKWAGRRPAAATAIALMLVLAVGAAMSAWLFKGQRDDARAAREDAVEKLRDSLVARSRAGRGSGRPGRRFDSLTALDEAARLRPGADLRDEVIACLTCTDMRLAKHWPAPPGDAQWVDFDDNFTRYVWVSADGKTISVRRVADDTAEMQIPSPGGAIWTELSRDGRFLWVNNEPDQRRQVWRLDGSAPVAIFDAGPAELHWVRSFRPDSGRIAVACPDGPIAIYDLPSGQLIRRLPETDRLIAMEYDPTGRRLAVATRAGLSVRDAETGVKLCEFPGTAGPSEGLAWHPAGDLLAVTAGDGHVGLWTVNPSDSGGNARRIASLEGRPLGGVRLTFNHSGDLIASTSWDGRLRLCDTATGRQVFSMPFTQNRVRFSADDRFLAGDRRDAQFVLWEIERSREYRTLVRDELGGRTFNYGQCAVSPDGRWLAVATDADIGVWDFATGRQRATLPVGRSCGAMFDSAGAFISSGRAGPQRWPMTVDAGGSFRVGPPNPLPFSRSFDWVAGSPDGRVFAAVHVKRSMVVNRDRPNQSVALNGLTDARDVAVSPDGRWIVTGDHSGSGLTVWNSDTGHSAQHLCDGHLSRSVFSPDGRFLAGGFSATDSKAFMGRIWEVNTWRELSRFTGMPLAFAPGGVLVAVETGQGEVKLLAPQTAAVVARLEDPNLERADFGCFTPDGAGLVLSSNDSPAVHVWDLRLIRSRLAGRGLDWNLTPYPSAATSNRRPVRTTVNEANATP